LFEHIPQARFINLRLTTESINWAIVDKAFSKASWISIASPMILAMDLDVGASKLANAIMRFWCLRDAARPRNTRHAFYRQFAARKSPIPCKCSAHLNSVV